MSRTAVILGAGIGRSVFYAEPAPRVRMYTRVGAGTSARSRTRNTGSTGGSNSNGREARC